MISSRLRMLGVLPLVAVLVGAVGCTQEAGPVNDPATAEGTAQALTGARADAAKGRPHRGPGRAGGPGFLLVAALHDLDLNAQQRATIQSALDKVKADRAGGRDHARPGQAAFASLASQVRAGKIDVAGTLASLPAQPAPAAEHRADIANAVKTLHDTLSADQRRELVAAVEKRFEEHGPRGDEGDHRRGDKGERHRGERGEHMHRGGPVGFLLHGIELTDAQREAVDRALAQQRPSDADREAMKQRFETMRKEMRARLETFASDAFDANAFVAPPAGMEAGPKKEHMEKMLNALAAIVPILDQNQREQLATRIEQGPKARMHDGAPAEGAPAEAPEE